MKNKEIYRQKVGNDLATELLLFCAFLCIFPFREKSKRMKYREKNQQITLLLYLMHYGVKIAKKKLQ